MPYNYRLPQRRNSSRGPRYTVPRHGRLPLIWIPVGVQFYYPPIQISQRMISEVVEYHTTHVPNPVNEYLAKKGRSWIPRMPSWYNKTAKWLEDNDLFMKYPYLHHVYTVLDECYIGPHLDL